MAVSQSIVFPTSPLHEPVITKLTPLDQIMPRMNFTLIHCIPSKTNDVDRISSLLNGGLQRTLTDIPYLSGHVVPDGKGRVRIETNPGDGVTFRVRDYTRDASLSFENLRSTGFTLHKLKALEMFAPLPLVADRESGPVMGAQANIVDGGVLLAVCVHHSVADVRGYSNIVETWAKNVSGVGLEALELDRGVLMSKGGRTIDPGKHMEYVIGGPPGAFPSGAPTTLEIIRFSVENLARLKAEASAGEGWVSTNDAVCALLWRSITIARASSSEEMSTLAFAVDGRFRMNPPLASSYIGNVNVHGNAMHGLSSLPSTSLAVLARSIREGVQRVDDARVRDVVELVDAAEDITSVRFRWKQFFGTDLDTTSWATVPLNRLDWGSELGKVERVRVPDLKFDGMCAVLPGLPDGSLEVMIGLVEEHMARLDLLGYGEVVTKV